MMTVDDLILGLQRCRRTARLGGDSVVHVCIMGEPYIPVVEAKTENDEDGSIILLLLGHQPESGRAPE